MERYVVKPVSAPVTKVDKIEDSPIFRGRRLLKTFGQNLKIDSESNGRLL